MDVKKIMVKLKRDFHILVKPSTLSATLIETTLTLSKHMFIEEEQAEIDQFEIQIFSTIFGFSMKITFKQVQTSLVLVQWFFR